MTVLTFRVPAKLAKELKKRIRQPREELRTLKKTAKPPALPTKKRKFKPAVPKSRRLIQRALKKKR
jgi:hypothetical protein